MVKTERRWVRKGRKGGETKAGRRRIKGKVEMELSMWVLDRCALNMISKYGVEIDVMFSKVGKNFEYVG
jgi:hypothetical protein